MRTKSIEARVIVVLAALACGCPAAGGADEDGGGTEGSASMSAGSDSTAGTDADGTAGDDGPAADGGDGGPGDVVECPDHPLSPAAGGTCEVTMPGGSGMLLRGTVLTPGGILRAGQVLVSSAGTVSCVDCDCSGTPGYDDATEITCGDGVISPGLINPHDHITYANNAPIGQGPDRYEHRHDWRTGANGHDELPYDSGASNEVILGAELRFVMSGATSLASAGGVDGMARNVDVGGRLEGAPLPVVDSDVFPLDDADGTTNDQGCNYGGSPTSNSSIEGTNAYLPHISEGITASARNEFVCLSEGSIDLIEPQTAVVHGVGLVAEDYALMQQQGTGLVWSPRSNIVLYGNTAAVTAMHAMGVSISLGTDWVSSGSMNMLRELACADAFNRDHLGGYFGDRALWKMATTNAAFAVGAEGVLGMLVPGALADIAVFRAREDAQDHRAIVRANVDDVVLVMRGGELLYGDDGVMAAAGGGDCEALDVCGTQKRVCMSRDTDGSTSLAQVRSALEAHYPLFFCDTPDDEPTCVPWRPDDFPDGITDADGDGDGIADDVDDCPFIFNPIRKLEQSQADADQDGLGDACDPCPLQPGEACEAPSPDDPDGDGIDHGLDNCPFDANPGQEDADGDGHGDLCDGCSLANPGGAPCPLTIAAIRDPGHPDHPAEGSVVAITGAYVTALRPDTGNSRGFYVQDDSLDPYSGIFVFTASQPAGVEVGNRVTVMGVYEEFFDASQIAASETLVEDAGTTLPFGPIVVPPADIATGGMLTESYEGMLLQVDDVTILDPNPDDPEDFDEFGITAGLRVDDTLTDAEVGSGLGNDCPAGAAFDSIVGVLGFSFSNSKLQPREAADVAFTDCDPFAP